MKYHDIAIKTVVIEKETAMLDQELKTQLASYLERVKLPFEMVASLDDSETGRDMQSRYKETSLGGLAVTVQRVDC